MNYFNNNIHVCYFHREFVAIPYAARSTVCIAMHCTIQTYLGTPCKQGISLVD